MYAHTIEQSWKQQQQQRHKNSNKSTWRKERERKRIHAEFHMKMNAWNFSGHVAIS